MSNLRPEQRTDKNGKVVTRHVKDGDDVTPSQRIAELEARRILPSTANEYTDPRTGRPYPANLSREDVDDAISGMAETAVFSSVHYDEDEYEDGIEMDAVIAASDISDEEMERLEGKFLSFVEDNAELVQEALMRPDYAADDLGGDLWYTINGHGTGFWDRPQLKENGLGDKLSEAAGRNEISLYLGDDGKPYFSGL